MILIIILMTVCRMFEVWDTTDEMSEIDQIPDNPLVDFNAEGGSDENAQA